MPPPEFWLTTERLALRRLTADDLDWLVALWGDAEMMRYAGGPYPRPSIEELLADRILRYYDERPGLGIWMTVERETLAPVGVHLLNDIRGESFVQVGFFLLQSARGKGFATEMAVELLRYGFVDLSIPCITAITALDNLASQRVLLRSGLHRNGERSLAHPAYAPFAPHAWFERHAADWLAELPRRVDQ